MLTESTIPELLTRVQRGDDAGATELCQQLRDPLKRIVRTRLRRSRPRPRSPFDCDDLCQEVMLDFFRGVANGAFSITTADDLWKLLTYIVNGVTSELVERSHRACRDIRRTIQLSDGCEHASPDPSPDETVERNEWWEMVLTRLNADDRRIFSMHLEGWKWTELAAQERTTAGALRMRIMRALRKAGALESEHLPLPQEEEP